MRLKMLIDPNNFNLTIHKQKSRKEKYDCLTDFGVKEKPIIKPWHVFCEELTPGEYYMEDKAKKMHKITFHTQVMVYAKFDGKVVTGNHLSQEEVWQDLWDNYVLKEDVKQTSPVIPFNAVSLYGVING
jgi:hypothetical protein